MAVSYCCSICGTWCPKARSPRCRAPFCNNKKLQRSLNPGEIHMFSTITVRTKILTLLGVAVLALLVVMAISFTGLKREGEMLAELGRNRMPSLQSLMTMNEAKTAMRSSARAVDALANYPDQADELAHELSRQGELLAQFDKAWKVYDPLPQTAEEEKVWNQFVKEWDDWKKKNATFTEQLAKVIRTDKDKRKEEFAELHKVLLANRDAFHAVEESLDQLVTINVVSGNDAVKEADAAAARAQTQMVVASVVALALLVGLGLLILAGILRQLGGDPSYAADIV